MNILKVDNLPRHMQEAAARLNEGPVVLYYHEHGSFRIETANGEDPYIWSPETNTWTALVRIGY